MSNKLYLCAVLVAAAMLWGCTEPQETAEKAEVRARVPEMEHVASWPAQFRCFDLCRFAVDGGYIYATSVGGAVFVPVAGKDSGQQVAPPTSSP